MSMRDQLHALLCDPSYRPIDEIELARRLKLAKGQRKELAHEVRRLLVKGVLVQVQGDRLRLRGNEGDVTGTISFKSQGKAFVLLDAASKEKETDGSDIFITPEETGTALHGDRVAVRILSARPQRHGREARSDFKRTGRVVQVIERARDSLVGSFQKSGRSYSLLPDDPRFPAVMLADPVQSGARPMPVAGDKLVVKLDPWTDRGSPLTGVVERRLGRQFEPGAELLGVFEKFSLDRLFPHEVDREAASIPSRVRPGDLAGRQDYRKVPTITIDPDDAKDFDDAISLEPLDHGALRVGVHIADVSAYVKPGTALDREAQQRGNSTYLVGTVVPMLPEKLSNGLCSLVEAEDRLTLAVLLTFDKSGSLKHTDFARTVIRSRKRLSYRQVQALLFQSDFDAIRGLAALPAHQTGSTGRPLSSLSDLEIVDLQSWLRKLWAIARRLRSDRMAHGCLDLNMPETKIYVDEKGYADRLVKMEQDESHQLIEEFMLAANESVARLTRVTRLPSLYRVHDDPDERKLAEFREFAGTLGVNCGDLSRREEIGKLLATAVHHPQGYILKSQLLRSLRKACYRATPDGHYGLNKKDYTHFTSPIRRYADLVVHRVLIHHLAMQAGTASAVPADRSRAESLAGHLSLTEVNSQEAERESYKIKLLEFFERESLKKPKTRFKAIITEIRMGGLFIELADSMTFGFIPAASLDDDYYSRNASGSALVGRRKHRQYKLGATIDVVVLSVDRFRRLIDFKPVA
ncbi:MAG: RNB domain-containing ribonuclease [Opitutaceae bacterium]|jgi:ribonuclease R